MSRWIVFLYGIACYAVFFVSFVYLFGFMGNLGVPKSIDTGEEGPIGMSILINLLLIASFAIQHTVMARPAFKAWWTRIVPKPVERSTFVLVASLILLTIVWLWRPMTAVVWDIEQAALRMIVTAVFFAGAALVFYSSFIIDHFDLFGLRQVYRYWQGREYSHPTFQRRSVYKHIRHPLMAGFLVALWAAPTMTQGHLLFSAAMTAYILMGIRFEERDLIRHLGSEYARYREQTPMLLPIPKRPAEPAAKPTTRGAADS